MHAAGRFSIVRFARSAVVLEQETSSVYNGEDVLLPKKENVQHKVYKLMNGQPPS